MRSHRWILWNLIGSLCVISVVSPAQAEERSQEVLEELKALRQEIRALRTVTEQQRTTIQAQEERLRQLEGRAGPAPTPPSPTKPSALPGQLGAALPEIGLLADIVATSSQSAADSDGNDRIAAREVELIVGGYVDPYSRLDATFAFSDFEAADIEEAYLTHWGLPWGLTGRFGRFFPRIGKAAAVHRDQLFTVDEPLVVRRYWGAEGYFRGGLDLTRPFGDPEGWVLQPSVGILEGGVGDGATTFGSTRRRLTPYSHLKVFRELGDLDSLELGVSHLAGSKDADREMEVQVLGADATFRRYVTPLNPLTVQGEFYLQSRDEAFSVDSTTGATTHFDRHPWGAYLLADYRLAPRWSVGGRLDHVRLLDTAASRHADQGFSAYLTFHQSEFARWRLQYRHEERASDKTDDAIFLQGTFAIGTHKHQLQ